MIVSLFHSYLNRLSQDKISLQEWNGAPRRSHALANNIETIPVLKECLKDKIVKVIKELDD